MIWLILGIIGTVLFFIGLFLVPVWIGDASYMDALVVFLKTIAILGFIALIAFALSAIVYIAIWTLVYGILETLS